jgi:heme-degrading monooxygenase HmoA
MKQILIRLTVQDYTKWKPVFDDYASVRKTSGSHGGRLFRNADNPNEVLVLWDWGDLESGRQFFQSQGLRETMQRAGVTGRPEVYYLDEVEHVAV